MKQIANQPRILPMRPLDSPAVPLADRPVITAINAPIHGRTPTHPKIPKINDKVPIEVSCGSGNLISNSLLIK